MIAVIPARGGSKRIPRKNIRPLSGRPLIAWSIESCLTSGEFSRVIVSTDDDEISAIAIAAGAEVPFVRPASLSDDHAPTVDVIAHAVEHLAAMGSAVDLVCCVYPASVFLGADDLRGARELLQQHPATPYAATVVPYPYPVQRALRRSPEGTLSFVQPEHSGTRTQDLETLVHDAGQFYWGRSAAWLDRVAILDNAVGYPVDPSRVVDIDTEDDWRRAEVLHQMLLAERAGAQEGLG
jgi:N-acylneuraminate cytidylyltransferase